MTEKKKEPEFVVTDRRKFTEEGERRPDVPTEAEPASIIGDGSAAAASSSSSAKIVSETFTAGQAQQAASIDAPPAWIAALNNLKDHRRWRTENR